MRCEKCALAALLLHMRGNEAGAAKHVKNHGYRRERGVILSTATAFESIRYST